MANKKTQLLAKTNKYGVGAGVLQLYLFALLTACSSLPDADADVYLDTSWKRPFIHGVRTVT